MAMVSTLTVTIRASKIDNVARVANLARPVIGSLTMPEVLLSFYDYPVE